MRKWVLLIGMLAAGFLLALAPAAKRAAKKAWHVAHRPPGGPYTVAQRVEQYGAAARQRWAPGFSAAGVSYPPRSVVLVGCKYERRLDVLAAGEDGRPHFIRSIPVLTASGRLGPKLSEGDGQVPEGIYPIESLNPNSLYHLALRVGYPNEFDQEQAAREGRGDLGGDIMIHGSDTSVGCLAVGDEAAEDLFVLAADTGIEHMKVVLTPVDFRVHALPPDVGPLPRWAGELYGGIRSELAELPEPK